MKKRWSQIVCLIMLTALTWQTSAMDTMVCEMPSDTHSEHMLMVGSQSVAMDMGADTVDHSQCCQMTCACPANACSAYTPLSSDNALALSFHSDNAIKHAGLRAPIQVSSSLYRPPITA
ncbi:hypothetical protein [Alteromonas lipotrueiana]|uniref:hypothetical protein n=1 Tax=Alteromonas lipotrueiana TaxID=2803815 RepID=UPI001C44D5F1|nr:hypothetical protein [Alteromonas lipotrueiana]|tara:strand:- start:361 stop:717 length:357 start_codon:yes stop_codon:yes gene_type:complete